MDINKAILHILDFDSDISVFSQKELDFSSDFVRSFIIKHIEHIQSDSNQKQGEFLPESAFPNVIKRYKSDEINFVEFSNMIANKLYESISRSDKLNPTDILIVDFMDNDINFIAFMLLNNRNAYTHQVINDDGIIHNEIIRHHAILPSVSQKIDSYAIIDCDKYSIAFSDKKQMIDGKDVYIIPDIILQCNFDVSPKEAVKLVGQITTSIAEEHGINSTVAISKAKNYLVENSEISSSFSPVELGKDVFADSDVLQNEFEQKVSESNLPSEIKLGKSYAVRTAKNHKIKTDTGIEIIFPVDYFENHDYIEFINNPDGTISIELKNIGKIINR